MPGRHRPTATAATSSVAGATCRRPPRPARPPRVAGAPPAPRRRCAARSSLGARRRGRRWPTQLRRRSREARRAATATAPRRRRPRSRAPERIAIDYADAADLAAKAEQALKALAGRQPGRVEGAARPRASSAAAARPARSPSSTPARARSTPTCSPSCARREPVVADDVRRGRRDHDAAARGRAAVGLHLRRRRRPDGRRARPRQQLLQHRDHPAGGADRRHRADAPARRVRHRARHGHGPLLGEYGALVAAGALSFEAALEAVSARGREMASLQRRGQRRDGRGHRRRSTRSSEIVAEIDGYVVLANVNCTNQAVHRRRHRGGRARRSRRSRQRGHQRVPLPVSHALPHLDRGAGERAAARDAAAARTCAAAAPDRGQRRPASFYPTGADVEEQMLDMLGRQVASPVQFVKGLHTLYDAGARVFVEVGPEEGAAGLRRRRARRRRGRQPGHQPPQARRRRRRSTGAVRPVRRRARHAARARRARVDAAAACGRDGTAAARGAAPAPRRRRASATPARRAPPSRSRRRPTATAPTAEPVVITGAGARACPGAEQRLRRRQRRRGSCDGEQFIDVDPGAGCAARCSTSTSPAWSRARTATAHVRDDRRPRRRDQAGRPRRRVRPRRGVRRRRRPPRGARARDPAGDRRGHRRAARRRHPARACTTRRRRMGTQLPDRWGLPDALRDDTGVIFASAFPGSTSSPTSSTRYYDRPHAPRAAGRAGGAARPDASTATTPAVVLAEVDRRIARPAAARSSSEPYTFDRRFLFRVPVDGPLAVRRADRRARARTRRSTPRARAPRRRSRWPRTGSAPAAAGAWSSSPPTTSPPTRCCGWIGAGFLASGAAATDEVVEDAALPFDRRRHGMILGHGRGRHRRRERRGRARARPARRSARCSARSPPTAPSTARGSTSSTSAA